MAERVRLSLYCPTCLPGIHLPFISAAGSGLFARYGLDVEILDPPPPPGATNSARVAAGGSDFCLTGVTYYLLAQKEAGDNFPARFVAVLHQRSALSAIVTADSDITDAGQLAGRRVGRGEHTGWLADECIQALTDRGLGTPVAVPLPNGEAPYALCRGDIDIQATSVDAMVGIGVKGGRAVRAIPIGPDIYGSGLVANDGISDDVVERIRAALAAAFALDDKALSAAIGSYCVRFPDVSAAAARQSWELLAPFLESPHGVGSMNHEKWARTLDWVARAHGLPSVDPGRVYRRGFTTG